MTPVPIKTDFPAECPFRVLRWDRSFTQLSLVTSPHQQRPVTDKTDQLHYHKFFEMAFVEQGSGTRFIGDRIEAFEAGDVVLLGEDLPHYWEPAGETSGTLIQWHVPLTHPIWAFAETEKIRNHFHTAARGIHYRGETAERLTELEQTLRETRDLASLGVLLQIFSTAANAPQEEQRFVATSSFGSSDPDSDHHDRMHRALRYILMHYREHISVDDLLSITCMSKPTFCRQFKRHTGKTLSNFIQDIRLHTACRELGATDKAIIDIAYSCGFSQISFFNRLFHRTFGFSPSHYRRAPVNFPAETEMETDRNTRSATLLPLPIFFPWGPQSPGRAAS